MLIRIEILGHYLELGRQAAPAPAEPDAGGGLMVIPGEHEEMADYVGFRLEVYEDD